jgi:hypothetical protein
MGQLQEREMKHQTSIFNATLWLTIVVSGVAAGQQDTGSASEASRGRDILRHAQEALGGAQKLASVRDFTQTIRVAMEALPGGVTVKQVNRYLAPAVYRQDEDMPFGKIISYTDGASGWRSTPRGSATMTPAVLKMSQDELFRSLFVLMAADRDPSVQVKATAPRTVEIAKEDGFSVRVEFDASTWLPLRKVYVAADPHGPPTEIEESYADWREVDGLKVPFKMTIRQNGKVLADETVEEFKFNVGLKADELSQKP